MSVNTTLAQNLLVARLALGWTQQGLAESSGVSRATIAQIEAGLGDPRFSTVELLATAFGVSVPTLLLTTLEIQSVTDLQTPSLLDQIHPGTASSITYLVASGVHRNLLEAARLGVEVVRNAGLETNAHAVGAAIGAIRYPARGIFVAARLAARDDQRPATRGSTLIALAEQHESAPFKTTTKSTER